MDETDRLKTVIGLAAVIARKGPENMKGDQL